MTLTRDEAKKVMESLSGKFMSAARAFDENGVNSLSITNSDVDWRNPAVDVGTKGPLSPELKQEVEDCTEKALGRKPARGDLIFHVNGGFKAF